MRDAGYKIKCMVKGVLNGQMVIYILEIILTIKDKDMEFLNTLKEKNIKEIGKIIKKKDRESIIGKTVVLMIDHGKKIKKMVYVLIPTQKEINIKDYL